MLPISTSFVTTLLCVTAASLSAQGVDSVEVTPHDVTRPVTQNTGTGVGACQQFMPWAYDANGGRVRRQLTYVWSVSNATDFEVDTITGGVCARQVQLSDTVTTVVTASIVAEGKSGTSSFTVTPDPALALAPPPPVSPPAGPGTRTPVSTTNPAGPGDVAGPADAAGTQRQTNTTPAPPPTQVTVSAISPTTLQISWGGVAGASGYYLYRSASAGGSFTGISPALIQGNVTTDPTLTPNTTAYYKVATIVPNMSPGYSGEVAGTTLPAPAPASLTATLSADQKSVTLTWPAPTGASGYRLLKDGAPVSSTPLRTTSYMDTDLLPGKEYRYQVAALYSSSAQGEFEGDLTNLPTAKVTRTEAMYRVLLVGFKVNHQTDDDPLQNDGKGDEVYFSIQVLWADSGGRFGGTLFQSPTMGDKNGFPSRLPYGSASSLGGLKTGDDIRFAVPWQIWKQTLWDRSLPGVRLNANVMLVTPTVWEFDGEGADEKTFFRTWTSNMDPTNGHVIRCMKTHGVGDWFRSAGAIQPLHSFMPSMGCTMTIYSSLLGDGLSGADRLVGFYGTATKSLPLTLGGVEGLLKGASHADLAFPYLDGKKENGSPAGRGEYVIFLRLERL